MLMKLLEKHVGSTHTRGSSPFGGSHQFDELTTGMHDNLGKMNLDSNSIVQPHTRLPTIGDLQFNLGGRFQPANVNFSLNYQPSRQIYPPNQVREDVASQRYRLRVNGNWGRDHDRQVRQPKGTLQKSQG